MLADEARQTSSPGDDDPQEGSPGASDVAPDVADLARATGEILFHPLDAVVRELSTGDPAAFEHLHGLMADRMFRLALRMLTDRQEAEDAVQQAFLELARAEETPSNGPKLQAWLYSSIRFTCLDTQRTRNRRPAIPHDEVPETRGEDAYNLGLDPALEAALALLTPDQRLVIHLKHVEQLDGNQIAEIIGSNRVAVYAMAGRAERRMRRYLEGRTGFRRGPTTGRRS